ncbi:MAG: 30S ribosomal protein S6 [Planctomycetes bacterium]|nr:30S ribosomal protein S6 [Planctomycetota bacterium]
MCLLDNREVRKGWEPVKESVSAVLTKHGAKVVSSRRWDERRLGYPVRGQSRGTYLLVYFESDTQTLTAIRRDLNFNEAVMRYLTLSCDEVPETAYEPEEEFDVNAIPVDDEPEIEASGEGPSEAAEGDSDSEEPSSGESSSEEGGSGDSESDSDSDSDSDSGDSGAAEAGDGEKEDN